LLLSPSSFWFCCSKEGDLLSSPSSSLVILQRRKQC
jgi:hypothetical protein